MSDTRVVTLTEFLLARIADDEGSRYAYWHDLECPVAVETSSAACSCGSQARILAECEAKRRMVSLCSVPDPHDAGDGCPECGVLYLLALPYADHPDYREEWRP